ncbi:drap catalyzes the third step of the riboflavin biosynthesis pathway [Plasmopara halstedii]|uniref:Drap catalyzes the third step of the riboflavin biosynthesis pathway n=1 Tax=Plasmopara halstedii TaxID=4781 RepID=A0A0P1B299_PLAHL|nr:drap catalyzes the third step of the riboflavin biosynthesis pathway [Plasmopara halstedii]CEG48380.1 drap catalyzes the third step of the riboflavin biosynthesis pathway [Plasmopara halstedii]|eukprot:XP_024584749.1 drap catalyzes the third step of the riboflavin biosynthesis pathway [Plasmopara halstedii]
MATLQDASDMAFMRMAITEAHRSQPCESNTHAEQVALTKLDFKADGATVYTTMEPCSKRLSANVPCVQSCLRAGVARVVIGVMEPKTFVICNGVQLLQNAGVDVKLLKGLERDCLAPNKHLNIVF